MFSTFTTSNFNSGWNQVAPNKNPNQNEMITADIFRVMLKAKKMGETINWRYFLDFSRSIGQSPQWNCSQTLGQHRATRERSTPGALKKVVREPLAIGVWLKIASNIWNGITPKMQDGSELAILLPCFSAQEKEGIQVEQLLGHQFLGHLPPSLRRWGSASSTAASRWVTWAKWRQCEVEIKLFSCVTFNINLKTWR